MSSKASPVPYASATSGAAARDETVRLLRRFGCEAVGFMDDFAAGSVLLQFRHRGREIQLRASAKGWAKLYLKENPWTPRHRSSRAEYEASALLQGNIAVNSIIRDWVKAQLTAVECDVFSFEAAFMPFVLLGDGRTVLAHAEERKLLPAPSGAPGNA